MDRVRDQNQQSMARLTPIRAIRAKCIECTAGSLKEVRLCEIPKCALYAYRMGKNPARKRLKNDPPSEITEG